MMAALIMVLSVPLWRIAEPTRGDGSACSGVGYALSDRRVWA
jgi:hypothetical protein